MPFVTAHLEIFHCMHHSVIPKSDLYFTSYSTLNALSNRTSKQLLMDDSFGKWNQPQHTSTNGCESNVRFSFAEYIKAVMY